jgi:hypothetical protein
VHEEGLIPEGPAETGPREHPERRFERAAPNQLWQSDIFTFLLRRQERLYVAAFLDDHSRYLVSFALAHHQKSSLVLEAQQRVGARQALRQQSQQGFVLAEYPNVLDAITARRDEQDQCFEFVVLGSSAAALGHLELLCHQLVQPQCAGGLDHQRQANPAGDFFAITLFHHERQHTLPPLFPDAPPHARRRRRPRDRSRASRRRSATSHDVSSLMIVHRRW